MVPLDLFCAAYNALGDEINDLANVEDDAEGRGSDHEVCEDLLLSGVADVAVHLVGAGRHLALDHPGQVEAVVDVVEDVEEGHLDACLHKQAQQIGPPQAAVLLGRVVVQLAIIAVLGPVFALALIPVCHVHDHQKGRARDENELQGPQADVGDGEEVVVADISAARLLGVAIKVFLLVAPHAFRSHHVHQHPEHEHHRQPDPPKCGGVLVHPAEERLEGLPVHGLECLSNMSSLELSFLSLSDLMRNKEESW